MSDTIRTPEFRGSFVNIIEPKKDDNDNLKYGMTIAVPKDNAWVGKLIEKIEATAKAAFNGKSWKSPFKDGDEVAEKYPNLAGHWYFNTNTKFKPQVINTKGLPITSAEDCYSGAWYRATISFYTWSHKTNGVGISFNLNNVLKVRDDEKFGGGTTALEDFDAFIDADDDSAAALLGDDPTADDLLAD